RRERVVTAGSSHLQLAWAQGAARQEYLDRRDCALWPRGPRWHETSIDSLAAIREEKPVEVERKSIWVASVWMVVISLVLFFLPLINGLLGGAAGGYLAGTWKR